MKNIKLATLFGITLDMIVLCRDVDGTAFS